MSLFHWGGHGQGLEAPSTPLVPLPDRIQPLGPTLLERTGIAPLATAFCPFAALGAFARKDGNCDGRDNTIVQEVPLVDSCQQAPRPLNAHLGALAVIVFLARGREDAVPSYLDPPQNGGYVVDHLSLVVHCGAFSVYLIIGNLA